MGLADEIEQEIRQATERIPFLLSLRTGFKVIEDTGSETLQEVANHLALTQQLLMAQAAVLDAHRIAILRLARAIDDLNSQKGHDL